MRTLFFLGLGVLTLGACNGSSNKCDTGDTGCVGGDSGTTGSGSGLLLEEANYENCGASTCSWVVKANGEIGTVELSIIETGDPTFESGCSDSVGSGGLVCGVWSEYHNAFELESDNNDYGGETKSLTLEVVDNYQDQQNNQSTLFDMSNSTIESQVTMMFTITDANGDYADCATYGDDPSFFSSECDNNWN
jgi:hypothetical protein